ncbi:MAG: hypothetical protein HZA31_10600 [Opitutae bacterium]|nr:hypothetical protein [Opitutae bacterium]
MKITPHLPNFSPATGSESSQRETAVRNEQEAKPMRASERERNDPISNQFIEMRHLQRAHNAVVRIASDLEALPAM